MRERGGEGGGTGAGEVWGKRRRVEREKREVRGERREEEGGEGGGTGAGVWVKRRREEGRKV